MTTNVDPRAADHVAVLPPATTTAVAAAPAVPRRIVVGVDWHRPHEFAGIVDTFRRLFAPGDAVELALVTPGPPEQHVERVRDLLRQLDLDTEACADVRLYGPDEVLATPFDVAAIPSRDDAAASVAFARAIEHLCALRAALDAGEPAPAEGDAAELARRLERWSRQPAAPPVVSLPGPPGPPRGVYVGGGRILVSTLWGQRLFASAADLSLMPQLVANGAYDVALVNFLLRNLRPGGAAFDVGANIGLFTILMGLIVGETGSVVAYEAAPGNAQLLRDNVAMSYQNDWVTIRDCAAGAAAGRAAFHVTRRFQGNGSLLAQDEWYDDHFGVDEYETVDVAVEPLDVHLGSIERIDVLKIDVEGGELGVFRGARGLIDEGVVSTIVFELMRPRMTDDYEAFGHLLREYAEDGWRFASLADDGSEPPLDVELMLESGWWPQVVMRRR